jgi:serine/threonine-protein kinase RsbT
MVVHKTLLVTTDADIISVRLQTRKVARELGFGTIDQARISLAASELARLLVKNQQLNTPAEIAIMPTQTSGHAGIQLVGTTKNNTRLANTQDSDLISAIELVDEYMVENHENGIRVTLMKWLS